MVIPGVDYSFDRPNPTCLSVFGYAFMCRYLTRFRNGKMLTRSEANTLTLAGRRIVLGYEDTTGRARDGYAAGVSDGETAQGQAAEVGCPPDRPIYFAVDWDASAHDLTFVGEYLRGAASVLGHSRVGVYGGYNTIDWAYLNHTAAWYWQTYAWSHGLVYFATHIHQWLNHQTICGSLVDYDHALQPDYGGWQVGEHAPAAIPTNLPNITEDPSWDYSVIIGRTAAALGSPTASIRNATTRIRNYIK